MTSFLTICCVALSALYMVQCAASVGTSADSKQSLISKNTQRKNINLEEAQRTRMSEIGVSPEGKKNQKQKTKSVPKAMNDRPHNQFQDSEFEQDQEQELQIEQKNSRPVPDATLDQLEKSRINDYLNGSSPGSHKKGKGVAKKPKNPKEKNHYKSLKMGILAGPKYRLSNPSEVMEQTDMPIYRLTIYPEDGSQRGGGVGVGTFYNGSTITKEMVKSGRLKKLLQERSKNNVKAAVVVNSNIVPMASNKLNPHFNEAQRSPRPGQNTQRKNINLVEAQRTRISEIGVSPEGKKNLQKQVQTEKGKAKGSSQKKLQPLNRNKRMIKLLDALDMDNIHE